MGVLEEAGGVGRGDCWVGGGYGAEEYGADALRVGEWGDDGWAGYVMVYLLDSLRDWGFEMLTECYRFPWHGRRAVS